VSIEARVVRQFSEGTEAVTLAKTLVLPTLPTMGTRLDLRAEGIEEPLTVVAVTLCQGRQPPSAQVTLDWERSLPWSWLARAAGRTLPATTDGQYPGQQQSRPTLKSDCDGGSRICM
jgi:hypothetical protein